LGSGSGLDSLFVVFDWGWGWVRDWVSIVKIYYIHNIF
jgi:hypothetical protein